MASKTFDEDMKLLKLDYPNVDDVLLAKLAMTTRQKETAHVVALMLMYGIIIAFGVGVLLGLRLDQMAMVKAIASSAPDMLPELLKHIP